ncbi:hypothetical protein [Streptomyces sp. NPDC090112]|uniref:hypothetical protein n=1 Tax=Streptomyces sp. NPDC090112 TaxID=3365949 RepID=UPI003808119C
MTGARAGTRSRPQPERPSGRWLRAAVFVLLSSVLAAAGHPLASGDPVSWRRMAGGAVCVSALSWLVAARSRPWWQVAAATGAAQLVLHRALSAQQQVHHDHDGAHDAVAHLVRTAHHGAWAMTAAHGVAAGVVALLLYRADRALGRLPETVGRWAQRAVAATAVAFGVLCRSRLRLSRRTRRLPRYVRTPRTLPSTMLQDTVVRRGPPGRCAEDVPLIPAG